MYKALKVLLHYSLMPKTTFLVFECHIDLIELKLCLSGAQMIFTRLCFVCQFGKKQTLFCSVANLFLLHEKYSQGHLLATGRAGESSKAGKKCGDQYMHAVSTGFAFKSLDIWTIRYVVRGIPHTPQLRRPPYENQSAVTHTVGVGVEPEQRCVRHSALLSFQSSACRERMQQPAVTHHRGCLSTCLPSHLPLHYLSVWQTDSILSHRGSSVRRWSVFTLSCRTGCKGSR